MYVVQGFVVAVPGVRNFVGQRNSITEIPISLKIGHTYVNRPQSYHDFVYEVNKKDYHRNNEGFSVDLHARIRKVKYLIKLVFHIPERRKIHGFDKYFQQKVEFFHKIQLSILCHKM